MNYGYFDDDRREYVITTPKTPVKWINYIGGRDFGGFVDQTGGALIVKGDPGLNRITRYIPQLPAADFRGETLYLRLHLPEVDGQPAYHLISPFFTPCLTPPRSYECRVGLGYCRFVSVVEGIQTEVTVFVPPGASCELRWVKVTNLTGVPVLLDAVPVVEYSHFDALKQFTNADWVPQTMVSQAHHEVGGRILLTQYAFMRRDTAINYFSADLPADSFETDRWMFLGDNEYGGWAHPASLDRPELPCTQAMRGDNIAALLIPLGELKPGRSRQFVSQLGQAENIETARQALRRFGSPASAESALQELACWWNEYLSGLQVNTPDARLNSMLNVHNPHQCYITKSWSRDLSLYQLGFGERGLGFRDSSQDVLGVLPFIPQEAKALLRLLLQVQRRSGSAMHQFIPLTMQASVGDSCERRDRPHYYSDDHLWAVLATCAYLKETGDLAFLDEDLPFYEKGEDGKAMESETVLEHLLRAVDFTAGDLGAHGLPYLGFADWNDTINLPPGAESVLAACLYGAALKELRALFSFMAPNDARLQALTWRYERMAETVRSTAWDGEWFISYFDEKGQPLGSRRNAAGQIYAYGQAWPILAGFAAPQQARSALAAVRRRLNTAYGIKLSTPGFNGFDPQKGGITTYPPGAKENCGIFLHVNPWVIAAETLAGDPEQAYRYYSQINPAGHNDQLDIYQAEPYVYPQNILSDEHPRFGLARNSWLSGTAAWMYTCGAQFILGVQPDYAGLRIAPCIPAEWPGYMVRRRFRGADYQIVVSNPLHRSRGVSRLVVDGAELTGSLVPILDAGQVHQIEVEM